MAMLQPCSQAVDLDDVMLSLRTADTPENCERLLSLSCFRRAETTGGSAEPFMYRHAHTLYSYKDTISILPHDPEQPNNSEAILTIRIRGPDNSNIGASRTLPFSDEPSFQHCLLQITKWVENGRYSIDEDDAVLLSRPNLILQTSDTELPAGDDPVAVKEPVQEPVQDELMMSPSEADGGDDSASGDVRDRVPQGTEINADEALNEPVCIIVSDDSDSDSDEAVEDVDGEEEQSPAEPPEVQGIMGHLYQ
ncbi:hypothetical protein FALBO_16244, partial [Fusarium albosuccineum]